MRLEQLEIENFKCFKSKKTFDFGRITVLTGANSSGKSTVIYSLLALLQSDNPTKELSLNGNYVELGDYKEIVNKKDKLKDIGLNIILKDNVLRKNIYYKLSTKWKYDDKFEQPNLKSFEVYKNSFFPKLKDNQYQFLYKLNNNKQIDIRIKRYDLMFSNKEWFKALTNISNNGNLKVKIDEGNEVLEIENFDIKSFLDLVLRDYDGDFYLANLEFVNSLEKELLESFDVFKENLNFIGPHRKALLRANLNQNRSYKLQTDGEGYLDQILYWEKNNAEELKKLSEILQSIGVIEEIKAKHLDGGRFEIQVKVKENSPFVSLSNVGSGVSYFLPIAVADLQLSNKSTLILAEPETHLHPSIQAKFADYLIKQITTTEKNYVIETHSEYFLNRLRLAIVKGELKKEDFKIYFLENNEEDTEVFDIDFTKTGAIKNAPKNFFETYFVDSMDIALNAFAE